MIRPQQQLKRLAIHATPLLNTNPYYCVGQTYIVTCGTSNSVIDSGHFINFFKFKIFYLEIMQLLMNHALKCDFLTIRKYIVVQTKCVYSRVY